jgi:uncharacterized membrane protein YfcA
MDHWEIILFFFAVALVYASVGFGGGSSYLAILALYGYAMLDIRPAALLCNIMVVGGSTLVYIQNGLVEWKKIIPLIGISIPMAFLGGMLPIREYAFFIILASALCVAAILMWIQPQLQMDKARTHLAVDVSVGGGIGLLAGMVGIGGGIFLSPVLYLIRWAQPKAIAATAAVFILANSIAGLAGQSLRPDFRFQWKLILPLILAVIIGGQIGSRLGITYFSQRTVKRATAVLVLYVSLRIFYKYLIT